MNGHPRANWVAISLSGGFALAGGAAGFFLPVFLKESLGFSGAAIGLLYGGLSVTSLVSAFPAGVCNDRTGSRLPLAAALLLSAAAVAGLAVCRSLWLYLPLFILYGLASNVFRISVDSLFLRQGQDAGGFGLYAAFRMAGMGLGTLGGGLLLARLDFPQTLLLLALLTASLCLFCPLVPEGGRHRPTQLSSYGADFGQPAALFFAAWLFLFTTHWGAEYTSYGLFLRRGLGLGLAGMGYFMAAQFAVITAAAWGAGRLLHSGVRPDRLLAAGLVSSGVGSVLTVCPDVAISFIFRGVHEVGDGLITVIIYVRIAELFKSQRIGGHLGLVQLVSTLGCLGGSLIFGPLGEHFGYWMPLAASGLTTLGLLPLQALWERRLGGTKMVAVPVPAGLRRP